LAHGATSGSLEERCVTLRRAVDEILRARQASSTSPYFFVVGAGISTPHVPVAREIVEHCKRHPHARSNHAPEFDGRWTSTRTGFVKRTARQTSASVICQN
jgi:hypothetical protein